MRRLEPQKSPWSSLSLNCLPTAAEACASPRTQCILRIAGDAFVALGQGDQLFAADDIVDRSERPVVGALKHLAKDGVGRIGAVGENNAGGGFQPLLFVSSQRGNAIAVFKQR